MRIFNLEYFYVMYKKINTVIFLLLFCAPLFSANYSKLNQNWRQLSRPPFVIYFQGKNQKNAEQVMNTVLSSCSKLSGELGAKLDDSTTVFICPSEEIFSQFVGKNFPDWSAGVAAPYKNVIILKSPNLLPDHADNTKIVIHELTHIILHKAVNQHPIPRWFDEGMAVYYSGEKAFASGSLISKALITKSIIDLKDIDEVLNFYRDKAQLAYQESYLAVLYLFEQFGKEKVKQIISFMGKGKSLDQAFLETIGMDVVDFEYEWHQHIKKKYRWRFLMDFDSYLWILILALFIFVFIMIRRRNKLTIQQWDQEDNTWQGRDDFSSSPWDTDDSD